MLIGIIHHGNEHIEEDHQGDDIIGTNMVAPTNSVNLWSAWTLVTYRLINPKMDQNKDCKVSNNLQQSTSKIRKGSSNLHTT